MEASAAVSANRMSFEALAAGQQLRAARGGVLRRQCLATALLLLATELAGKKPREGLLAEHGLPEGITPRDWHVLRWRRSSSRRARPM